MLIMVVPVADIDNKGGLFETSVASLDIDVA